MPASEHEHEQWRRLNMDTLGASHHDAIRIKHRSARLDAAGEAGLVDRRLRGHRGRRARVGGKQRRVLVVASTSFRAGGAEEHTEEAQRDATDLGLYPIVTLEKQLPNIIGNLV